MSFVDILPGAGIVLFIIVLAGVIAYAGDRIGHQVGRKRLTLFNIRPRYTSTIIAVATGMIIALVVTLAAIFASNEVKTAFFRLNQINAEIAKEQARATALERKVNRGRVVVNFDTPMTNTAARIPQNASPQLRRQIIGQFYAQTVAYVNRAYAGVLRPFKPPADVQRVLDSFADSPRMQASLAQGDVLLIAAADQNLYQNDPIHFGITLIPDRLVYHRGDMIAQENVPSGKNVSAQLALAELLGNFVPQKAVNDGFPPYFVIGTVRAVQMLPANPAAMQSMLSSGVGNFVMTAFAATDIYPHTFGVPVVVVLQKLP